MADDGSFAFDVDGAKLAVPVFVRAFVVVCLVALAAGVCLAVFPGGGPATRQAARPVGVGDPVLNGTDGGPISAPSTVVPDPLKPASAGRPAPPAVGAPPAPPPPPMSIGIPAIGVSSHVIALGLQPDGTLQTPSDYGEAGWGSGGPAPGAVGPAVIVGHVDSTSGPAVFFHLRDLKPGDLIWVTRADGTEVSFVVRRLEQVPKSRFPTKEVYGPQPYAALRLITCGGAFDRSTGHYVDNVIVFADTN
jgi:Sortase domain